MKRFLSWTVPVVLGACACGLLADDSPPPANTQGANTPDANAYIWFVEHSAAGVSKDAETSAVQAVIEAKDLLRSKEPQVSIDFFTKALYDAKSPAVKRAIRMTLYDLFKTQGQNDKALEQLQMLIVEQE